VRKILVVSLALLAVMLFASAAFAFPSMSPDGVTCQTSSCHVDAAPPGAPAATPEPAKEEPAAAEKPAAKATSGIKQTVKVAYGSKTVELQAVNKSGHLYVSASDFNGLFGANTSGDEVALRKSAEEMGLQVEYKNGVINVFGSSEATGSTGPAAEDSTIVAGLNPSAALPGYVGSDTCGKCHPGTKESWMSTNHATMVQSMDNPEAYIVSNFQTNKWFDKDDVLYTVAQGQRFLKVNDGVLQYAEAQWDPEAGIWTERDPRDYTCGSCHNTGFNEETGAWAENGITCESCHGPGQEHATTGDASKIVSNVGMDMCSSCHGEDRQSGQMKEMWMAEENGGHLGLFANEIGADPNEPGYHYGDGCLGCHSGTYIVAEKKGETPPSYDDFMSGDFQSDRYGITCVVCHDPHAKTGNEYQLREDVNTTCVQCHTNSGGVPERGGTVHHPQRLVWDGVVFNGESEEPVLVGNPKADIKCVDCHMTDGNHFFEPGTPTITLYSHGNPYEADSCGSCHSNMTAEDITSWQEEYEEQVEALSARLVELQAIADADAGDDAAAAQPYLEAATSNLSIAEHDGSMGIHNVLYAEEVFEQVTSDLDKAEELLP